jgi:hypothetical protein
MRRGNFVQPSYAAYLQTLPDLPFERSVRKSQLCSFMLKLNYLSMLIANSEPPQVAGTSNDIPTGEQPALFGLTYFRHWTAGHRQLKRTRRRTFRSGYTF